MRKLLVNGWGLALVVLLIWGLLAALAAALQGFRPEWVIPGLLPVGVLIAIEALTTQHLVMRERLAWSEQWPLRALEWGLLLVAIRLWTLLNNDQPVIDQVLPWLRDPLQFFGQQFGLHVLLALISWTLATMLGNEVLLWGATAPIMPSSENGTIERGQIHQEHAFAAARFTQRISWIVLAAAALSVFALRNPAEQPLPTQVTGLAIGGSLACLMAALLLHSYSKLNQWTGSWYADGAVVDPQIVKRWRRSSLLVTVLLLVSAPFLGTLVLLAPPPPIAPILNGLLVVGSVLLTLALFLVSLLLLPFVWLLSLLGGRAAPPPPTLQPIIPPQIPIEAAQERPLAPALIFWACLAVLLGIAVVRYLRQRSDLLVWLRRWRSFRWLERMVAEVWVDGRGWLQLAATTIRARLRRRPPPRPRQPRPTDAHGQLRALYRQLVRAGAQRGVEHQRSQTPWEYGAALGQAIPPAQPDLTALTDTYVRAEYGPQAPTAEDVRRGHKFWRRIRRRLRGRT